MLGEKLRSAWAMFLKLTMDSRERIMSGYLLFLQTYANFFIFANNVRWKWNEKVVGVGEIMRIIGSIRAPRTKNEDEILFIKRNKLLLSLDSV